MGEYHCNEIWKQDCVVRQWTVWWRTAPILAGPLVKHTKEGIGKSRLSHCRCIVHFRELLRIVCLNNFSNHSNTKFDCLKSDTVCVVVSRSLKCKKLQSRGKTSIPVSSSDEVWNWLNQSLGSTMAIVGVNSNGYLRLFLIRDNGKRYFWTCTWSCWSFPMYFAFYQVMGSGRHGCPWILNKSEVDLCS